MTEKILFVDDDRRILNGIRRQFDDIFEFETAINAEEGLETLDEHGPFAVVVSDMRMPGMQGVEFLARVKERSPEIVRIMLTGYADLQATIDAVNEGSIFRFLSKPCPPDVLQKAVDDGLAQYRLVTAEHELLEGTLHGSIKVLSEILSLVSPLGFGRTSQVQRIALNIGALLELPSLWDLKIATMLFPLGCVTVPETTLESALSGQPLPAHEEQLFAQHPSVARDMLGKIPRLEYVATIVAYQDKGFDGSGLPDDGVSGTKLPIEARILKVASDFEMAYKRAGEASQALEELYRRRSKYDPRVIDSLRHALHNGLCQSSRREISIDDLREGMLLASDVRSTSGQLMVAAGQEVTQSIRGRLNRLCETGVIRGTFQVEMLGKVEVSELAVL